MGVRIFFKLGHGAVALLLLQALLGAAPSAFAADLSRAQIEEKIGAAGQPLDLADLDLGGVDLSGPRLARAQGEEEKRGDKGGSGTGLGEGKDAATISFRKTIT